MMSFCKQPLRTSLLVAAMGGALAAGPATAQRAATAPTGTSTTPTGIATTPTGMSTTPTGMSTTPTGMSSTPTGISNTPTGISNTPTGMSPVPPAVESSPTIDTTLPAVPAPPASTSVGTPPPIIIPPPSPLGTNSALGTNPGTTGIVPSKSELSSSAFDMLDTSKRGFVTREDVAKLPGFDSAFQQADENKDGRLSLGEFDRAWMIYSQQL